MTHGPGTDRRSFLAGAALLAATPVRAMARSRPVQRLTPADFEVVIDAVDGAEGIATAPGGLIAFSTTDAAAGLRLPDGTVRMLGAALAPGGMSIDGQGRILAASVGALKGVHGPLRRVDATTGEVEVLAEEIGGRKLVASNSPVWASDGTIYCSHSGWTIGNIGTTQREGFIYAISPGEAPRIVAKGLRGANGLCLGPDERRLFCAVTAEARVASWRRRSDGMLDRPRWYGPRMGTAVPDQLAAEIRALDPRERGGTGYCDGLAFDAAGTLWVTLPFANRLVAVKPDGRISTVIHDPIGERINFPTNLAWGGEDMRDLFVVSRGSGQIVRTRTAVPGLRTGNWIAQRRVSESDPPIGLPLTRQTLLPRVHSR